MNGSVIKAFLFVLVAILVKGKLQLHEEDLVPEEVLENFIPASRCRTACVAEFLKTEVSTKACQEHDDCAECWELCHLVQVDPYEAEICSFETMFSDECDVGCQEACLHFNYEDDALYAQESFPFQEPLSLSEVSHAKWMLSWSRPITPEDIKVPLVYVLLYMASPSQPWIYGGDTADTFATIDGQLGTYSYLEFRVLAVGGKGIVDQTGMIYPNDFDSTTPLPSTTEPTLTVAITFPSSSAPGSVQSANLMPQEQEKALQMSVILVNEALQGILSILPPGENVDFLRISLVRISCRVNHFLPVCALPTQRRAQEVSVQGNKQTTITLKDLTYNSAYLLKVTSDGQDSSYDETLFFMTSSCKNPDATFLHCSDDPEENNAIMSAKSSAAEGNSNITIFLVAFGSSALVVLIFLLALFLYLRCNKSDSSSYTGTTESSLPVPIITVDGKNYISLEHLQHGKQSSMDQRRNISISMPNLLTCDSPKPVRATSTPKDTFRIV